MKRWTVQLTVTPPIERPNQQGFVVYVEIMEESMEIRSASSWANQHCEWMQETDFYEIRQSTPNELAPFAAVTILESIRLPLGCLAAKGDYGWIHPTRFQLTIWSGSSRCAFEWFNELPQEWLQLQNAVRILEEIGLKAKGP